MDFLSGAISQLTLGDPDKMLDIFEVETVHYRSTRTKCGIHLMNLEVVKLGQNHLGGGVPFFEVI